MTNLTSSLYKNTFPIPFQQTESETSFYKIIVISNVIRRCISKKTHISENLTMPSTSKVPSKSSKIFENEQNLSKDARKKLKNQSLKETMSKASRARWSNPEWREKQLKAYKKGWSKESAKEKKSKASRARWSDPEWKEKVSKAYKKGWASKKAKEKKLEVSQARWADQESKEKNSSASLKRIPGMLPLSRQRADEAIASVLKQVIEIKVEPQGDLLLQGNPELQIIGDSVVTHEVNNSLPILQDLNNPTHSLFNKLEGPIDEIKICRYGDLPLSSSQKKQMLIEVKEWIRVNEQDKEAYQKKLEELFEINIPIDIGPDRGRSVYAKRNIRKFEVVGPYAGILYKNEDELNHSMRQRGSYNILSYLFGTRSKYRTIDGFNAGNTISLINTGQLPGSSMWKENNLSVIQVGKNLNFYVANRDISHGEELLVDYGPDYNPMHHIKVESGRS